MKRESVIAPHVREDVSAEAGPPSWFHITSGNWECDKFFGSIIIFLRVSAYKNRPKSPINGTSQKIDFVCILPMERSK